MISLSRSNFILHSSGKLEDKYTSQSKIGEGAFGSVFSSILNETSEPRAVKHILKSTIKYPERLQSEISTLLSCDHPHIIKLYEIFEDRKNLFLIMEQCTGGELFDYILNNSKIPEAESSVLFRQIMLAVNYLHSKNIAHRDLKPENLMFSDTTTLKLIDFGIAKQLNPEEEMKTRAGTVSLK